MTTLKQKQGGGRVMIFFLGIISVLGIALSVQAVNNVYCKDVFPGDCTQGGCAADDNWQGQLCKIKCKSNPDGQVEIPCGYPRS